VKISLRNTLKLLIGLAGLPLSVAFMVSFFAEIRAVRWLIFPNYLLLCGFGLYALFFTVMKERSFAYVLGHELMHALSARVFGGRLVSIFISQKKGRVKTTKDNFVIALSPYCVPFYAFILVFAYYLLSIFTPTRSYLPIFIFLLGYALAHHLFFTIHYLKMGQTDVSSHGRIFSFFVIVSINIILSVCVLDLFVPQVSNEKFWGAVLSGARNIYLYRW
jgi:hypothetical protein